MRRLTWFSAALVAIVVAGPFAPMVAMSQTPAPPPPPAPAPASSLAPPAPMQSMQPETVDESIGPRAGTGAKVGAGVLNVVYLPGKAIICTAGTLVAGAFMLATFGSAYREAASFFNEGCGGAWLLTPEQVAAVPKKAQLEY